MTNTTTKQERRYRRTEALILNGLISLLQRKSIKEITVRKLTDLIDINQSTFYLHYTNIFDLLEQTEQRLLNQFQRAERDECGAPYETGNFFHFLENTFTILSENAPLCSALIEENGDIAFLRTLEAQFREVGMKTLRSFAPPELREQDLQYATSFALAGCMGMVEHWLKSGCPETPTHMAELTLVLLREGTTSIGAKHTGSQRNREKSSSTV
ncbi:MAG: TetR family transcriptional regulator C-terminal domain-containing protein [Ruminococcus sp.]|nr:TetR family transcriptional regulator C-terminal domain-containing protein [Ruminococcus sp.]